MPSSEIPKLDQSIKGFYQNKTLSDKSMDRLLSLNKDENPKHTERLTNQDSRNRQNKHSFNMRTNRLVKWMMHTSNWQVAMLLLSFSLTLGLLSGYYFKSSAGSKSNSEITQNVLSEIAMNHNKNLNVEYAVPSYDKLSKLMERLDFSLQKPNDLPSIYQLIGGRYCSIQGNLAAQLKIRDSESNKIATFYVTPINKKLLGINKQTITHSGVQVTMWNDKNNFYGLAVNK